MINEPLQISTEALSGLELDFEFDRIVGNDARCEMIIIPARF